MSTLTIHDETASGRTVDELTISYGPPTITVRELVRLRVREEVARHNANPSTTFRGLVRPTDAEQAANGYELRKVRTLDWEAQADVAVDAFTRNGFFILVGDRQVLDLDEVVDLAGDPHIAFVRLTPLAGG